MKILTKIIFFLLIIFILNIIFYYISDDYKSFLEDIKYSWTNNNVENNIDLNNDNLIKDEKIQENTGLVNSNNEKIEQIKISDIDIVQKTVLWKNYINILNKFEKIFDLDKIEVNTKLFEITDEYPDYYYEYYSSDLTIYFFTTKQYSEIYDIFNYLQNDLPFTINEVNNFWEKSFYINLNKEINDNYIRFVITQNWISFWLKIKSTQYETVKDILTNKI